MKQIRNFVLIFMLVICMVTAPVSSVAASEALSTEKMSGEEMLEYSQGRQASICASSKVNVYPVKTSSSLNSAQKRIYNWVKNALSSSYNGIRSKRFYCNANDYAMAYYAINDAFFQYYSVVPLESIGWYYPSNGIIYMYDIDLDCRLAKERYKRSKENKSLVASRTKKVIGTTTSTRTKVLRIRNYVVNRLSYKASSLGTLDTSLRGTTAKCTGYAVLFQAMCIAAGIPCRQVIGYANGLHDWNYVKIGSRWYYSDPTWYDSGKNSKYSISTTNWGRTEYAHLYTLSFRSRGYKSDKMD